MAEGFYEFADAYRHEHQQINRLRKDEAFKRLVDSKEMSRDLSVNDYYERLTYQHYAEYMKQRTGIHDVDPLSLYRARMFNQSLGQFQWNLDGRPYCKVYPGMANMLARTKLSIDCEFFKLPFPAMEVRFSIGQPFRAAEGDPPLKAVLMFGLFTATYIGNSRMRPNYEGCSQMLILLDFGEKFPDEGIKERMGVDVFYRYYHYIKLNLTPGFTIEEQLRIAIDSMAHTPIDDLGYTPPIEFQRKVLSVCVATTFFMRDQHEVVCPDIPPRHKLRYERALKLPEKQRSREVEAIVQESKKINNYGWHVGREIDKPGVTGVRNAETVAGDGGSRGELKWRQFRDMHPRWQKYGPRENPTEIRLIWIKPTIVRPDLPARPVATGYKISDKLINKGFARG